MSQLNLDPLQYPIGRFVFAENITPEQIATWIQVIEDFPLKLLQLAGSIEEDQLSWCYRPDGWNIRQVIHHVADSHMNSLVRFKWALTEDEPTIKAYEEGKWALLADSQGPIEPALAMIDGLHERWSTLLRSMDEDQLKKGFVHPESKRRIQLDQNIGLYAWHCEHHYAHILLALEHEGRYKT